MGIAFGFECHYTAAGNEGRSVSVDATMYGVITFDDYWSWHKLDFFANADEGSAALSDFKLAQAYCVTGFSAIVTNNANSLKAGGSIKAAQLPGGTRYQLPGTPSTVYTFVANRATRRRMENNKLKKGAFWSYKGEKLGDYLFRQHHTVENEFLFGDKHLPYGVVAYEWADEESQPQLSVTINIALEYITNSNVAPKWMSPCDSARLMELWLGLGSEDSNWSENPEHLDAIKRWSKQIFNKTLGNEQFRNAAIKSAVALGTLALA